MRKPLLLLAALSLVIAASAGKGKQFELKSPNGAISVRISIDSAIRWRVDHKGQSVLAPSVLALTLGEGEVLGRNVRVLSSRVVSVDSVITPVNYKKAKIQDRYNQLVVNCAGDYSVVFRVYDGAVAYRWVTRKKGEIVVQREEANFNFPDDEKAFIPIQLDYRDGQNFNSSFEALYHEIRLSQLPADSLAFLPILVDIGRGKKVAVVEADLQDYPGMYLDRNQAANGLKGVYAPYPLESKVYGINYIPRKRADYIARTTGSRSFPWRAIVISEQDKDLLDQDIVQQLAAPSPLGDVSWIRPGQAAWDWWNNWNISHVDFKAGINTPTYKYYIDFAAANRIPYIIMDEGWSDDMDLMKTNPMIDVQAIVDYGKQKGVGVILWATWYTVTQQMDKVFPYYAGIGVKGFKIDFIDRDDQAAIASTYAIAQKAAQYRLMVDYHGTSKPAGLQRTYPNVIGYEGVRGLENFKWTNEDAPRYAVSIPFIRMIAGPMDYTPGAMRNATNKNYRAINDNPMSKGTRCQQLAEYIVYEAPLQMLSDNPTIYMKEKECTDFITKIPTTFDETVALDGKVAEYAAIARRKGDVWYVGAMSNWDGRDLTIDCSFLPEGDYEAEVFKDGVNADRDATDYERQVIKVRRGDRINVRLYGGGGWAARIYPVRP